MSGDDRRFPYWPLLREMTRSEILLRDQGTLLGFVWTLLHPALMFAVLYALFSKWMGKFVPQYVAYLLVGIVLWNFFQKATSYALGSFRRSRGTLINYRFPREIVVLSSLGAVLWSSLMEAGVLVAALLLLGVAPRASWVWLPGVLLLELVLATGVGLYLAVFAAEYQDVERIWDVVSSALFYLTPVFYPVDILSPGKRELMRLNPLAQILAAFRACVLGGATPDRRDCAFVAAASVLLAASGLVLLRRREHKLMDKLLV